MLINILKLKILVSLRKRLCNAPLHGKVGNFLVAIWCSDEGGNHLFRCVFCDGEDPEILLSGVGKWCCRRGNVGFSLPHFLFRGCAQTTPYSLSFCADRMWESSILNLCSTIYISNHSPFFSLSFGVGTVDVVARYIHKISLSYLSCCGRGIMDPSWCV